MPCSSRQHSVKSSPSTYSAISLARFPSKPSFDLISVHSLLVPPSTVSLAAAGTMEICRTVKGVDFAETGATKPDGARESMEMIK